MVKFQTHSKHLTSFLLEILQNQFLLLEFQSLRLGNEDVRMFWTLKHNSTFVHFECWFNSPYLNYLLCQKRSVCTLWYSTDI